jgi:uncharacterized protein
MLLTDVNVLIYAFRADAIDHSRYKAWLEGVLDGDEPYYVSELVLSGFLRVVTHPRIFKPPSELSVALDFLSSLRNQPNCTIISPSPRHWDIFTSLCTSTRADGEIIPDAYFAALAIDSGSEWITTDRDFRRFPGLRWRHPLRRV